MSDFSPDSVHLASQLRHPPNHSLNVSSNPFSPTIISSSSSFISPLIITSKPPSGGAFEHKQRVSIPLSKLKEIPAPTDLHEPNKTRNRVLEKDQGELQTFNQEIPEAKPVIKRVDLSDTTMRSSHVASRHQSFVMPIENVSHDYTGGSDRLKDSSSLITSSENSLSFSALPKTELKQEVIPPRNKSNGRDDLAVDTPSINYCDETLKLDKVVSEGYRVLKEVKRHKNKAEMEWDLVRLEESRLAQPLPLPVLKKISQQESRKNVPKQKIGEKPQAAENNRSSLDPSCLSHSPGLPEMQQLYQCIATMQLPFAHVSYQPHPPVFPWQPATVVAPDPVIHSKDIGVQIEKEKEEIKKVDGLVLEVLPPVNIHECEQLVEEPSQDNCTIATPNDLSPNDSPICSNEPSPVTTPEPSPQSSPNMTCLSPNMPRPSPIVHCDCSCKRCEEGQLLPSSDIVNQRMQNHITTQAKEWAQREIMASVLSRVSTDTQDGASIPDSEVVDLVRKELFEQMLLLLKETPCKEDTVSDQTHFEESLKSTEYSLSFETETSETHAHPQMLPTPQTTPPPSPHPSPPPSLQFDMIPTPEPSPAVPKQEYVIDSLSSNVSTPDVTTETSVHSEKTNSLTTPSIYSKSEDTPIGKPSMPANNNISLSLSETTPTSSTPPSTNIPLSTTFTSTDHDISYGEQLVSHPNISGRGSEGEVILSPGDVRWKTQVPLRLKVITSGKKKGLDATISDGSSHTSESQVTTTSIGEIKTGKTGRGNNPFDRYLHPKLSTSTPDGSDTSHNDTMSSKREEERVNDEDTLANVPSLSEELSLLKLDPENGNHRLKLNIRKATENGKDMHKARLSPGEIRHVFHNNASTVDTTQSVSVGEVVDIHAGHTLSQDVNSISSTSSTSSTTNRLRDGIDVIDVSSSNHTNTGRGSVHNGTMHNRITISSIAPADTPQHCDTLGMTGPVILMGSNYKDDLTTDDCSFTFSTSSIPLPN